MQFLDALAENHIRTAIERGELDNLEGQGKPLVLDDDSFVPEDLRAGYRILKNSGFLPVEIATRAEIRRLEDLMPATDCDNDKSRLVAKLAVLKSQLSNVR